jgi:hypothetical protein
MLFSKVDSLLCAINTNIINQNMLETDHFIKKNCCFQYHYDCNYHLILIVEHLFNIFDFIPISTQENINVRIENRL